MLYDLSGHQACSSVSSMTYGECLGNYVITFIDDILIYSPDLQTHISQVSDVLKLIQENQLYVKGEKCEFPTTSVSFLGYAIDQSLQGCEWNEHSKRMATNQ